MKTRILATWVFGLGCILALGSAAGQEAPAPQLPIPEASAKPAKTPLSGWAFEVAKLVQAGVEQSVTLTFITNSAGTFNLGAEQIITLRDLGVSNEALQAMIAHDQEIASGARDVFSTAPLPAQPLPIVLVPSPAKTDSTPQPAPLTASTFSIPSPAPAAAVETAPVERPPVMVAANDVPLSAQIHLCAHKQAEGGDVYRVREPNAVQLTAPILVWRGEGRVPNTMVLQFR